MAEPTTQVSTEDLKIMFDVAISYVSIDSGHLETDDVEALRRFAAILGVDPITATPDTFARQYPHRFHERATPYPPTDRCDHCIGRAADPIHQPGDTATETQ